MAADYSAPAAEPEDPEVDARIGVTGRLQLSAEEKLDVSGSLTRAHAGMRRMRMCVRVRSWSREAAVAAVGGESSRWR